MSFFFCVGDMLAATLPRRQAPRLGLGAVRFMSRVGKLPVKVPPSVTIKIEAFPESAIMPFKPLTPKRPEHAVHMHTTTTLTLTLIITTFDFLS